MTPLVSICMTCKDRWELTRAALESIAENTPKNIHHVAIFDDNSSDENKAELSDWVNRRPDTVFGAAIYDTTIGVGGSKNFLVQTVAAAQLRTKYLCLLDNDVVCKPGWLETLIGAWQTAHELGYRLLGGYAHPFNQTNRVHECFGRQYVPVGEKLELFTLHEKNAVDGLCHFMDWETWDKFGPYDSHAQGVRQSEDFAFCRKIVAADYKVGVVYPHVIENHGVVDTFGERIPGAELIEKELGVT